MTDVTWINTVPGLVDVASKVIFFIFRIIIIILMIIWLWSSSGIGRAISEAFMWHLGGGSKLGSRRLNSR